MPMHKHLARYACVHASVVAIMRLSRTFFNDKLKTARARARTRTYTRLKLSQYCLVRVTRCYLIIFIRCTRWERSANSSPLLYWLANGRWYQRSILYDINYYFHLLIKNRGNNADGLRLLVRHTQKVRGWVRWMEKVRRIIYRRFSVHTFRRIGIYKVQVSKDMRVDQEIYSYTYVGTCLLRIIYIYNITDIVVESCCYLGYLFFFFFFFYIILNARIREKAQINAVK